MLLTGQETTVLEGSMAAKTESENGVAALRVAKGTVKGVAVAGATKVAFNVWPKELPTNVIELPLG